MMMTAAHIYVGDESYRRSRSSRAANSFSTDRTCSWPFKHQDDGGCFFFIFVLFFVYLSSVSVIFVACSFYLWLTLPALDHSNIKMIAVVSFLNLSYFLYICPIRRPGVDDDDNSANLYYRSDKCRFPHFTPRSHPLLAPYSHSYENSSSPSSSSSPFSTSAFIQAFIITIFIIIIHLSVHYLHPYFFHRQRHQNHLIVNFMI